MENNIKDQILKIIKKNVVAYKPQSILDTINQIVIFLIKKNKISKNSPLSYTFLNFISNNIAVVYRGVSKKKKELLISAIESYLLKLIWVIFHKDNSLEKTNTKNVAAFEFFNEDMNQETKQIDLESFKENYDKEYKEDYYKKDYKKSKKYTHQLEFDELTKAEEESFKKDMFNFIEENDER